MYPGTYQSAYQNQCQPPPPPYGYFPPPQQQWYPQPQQQGFFGGGGGGGGDFSSQLISLITTLPALKTASVNATALSQALAAIVPPAAIGGTPNASNYNDLVSYVNQVRTAVVNNFNNDSTALSALKTGMLLQLLTGAGQGGANSSLFLVLALTLGGGF